MDHSQAQRQVVFMLLHDRQAELAEGAHKAVLRNVLGAYKLIITPIGMSDGAFTSLFTLPSSLVFHEP